MKHDLNRYGYINLVVSLLVRKLYYERYKKKINSRYYFCLFYNQYAIFAITALKFHSAQQVSKNSLLHALIKQLKYLQIQNRCSITEKSSPENSL